MAFVDQTAVVASANAADVDVLVTDSLNHSLPAAGPAPVGVSEDGAGPSARNARFALLAGERQMDQVLITLGTTFSVFLIYLIQGVLTARILGPVGRGEFSTALFFPRDILLYVGLLGGIDILNRNASRGLCSTKDLKQAAAQFGWISGSMTALAAAVLSTVVLLLVNNGDKAYLIPYCLLVCLFVPWEHVQLIVSGVDLGRKEYLRYNWNRLCFAAAFPVLLLLLFVSGIHRHNGQHLLLLVCLLFVVSRVIGMLPAMRELGWRDWFGGPVQNTGSDRPAPSTRSLLREGRPYAVSMLATELFERLDVLLIVALASVEQSGFYFVAIPAATLLTIAPNALGVFSFNAGAEGRSISLTGALSFLLGIAAFQIAATICLALMVPQLIVALYGADFGPSIDFVWYLLPACAIKGFLQAVDGYLKGCGRPLIGVAARSISIVVMLAFVALVYPQRGLLSIPMAAVAGQFVSMTIITTFAIREVVWRRGRS